MCNTCLFSTTPGGDEEADDNIKIVCLMALQLKRRFDTHFIDYKDKLGELNKLMEPYSASPGSTKNQGKVNFSGHLTDVVEDFFKTIKHRISYLESSVLKEIDKQSDI
jgi:hypothetical protein